MGTCDIDACACGRAGPGPEALEPSAAGRESAVKADAKLPEVSLKFASEEYFKLINQLPKLADYFALGQRVVVVWQGGKVYRVTE